MKAKPRRKSATLRALEATTRATEKMQQAFLRVLLKEHEPPADARTGPARFVHCWAVYGRPVTQALDEDGQVWELHTVMDGATKKVAEQFWTPLGMERRKP